MTQEPQAQLLSTERVIPQPLTAVMDGKIIWAPAKSIWYFAHALGAVLALLFFPQWDAVAVFVLLTVITICAGHSVGMHRLLIHQSFETSRRIEHFLVWLGTLVGMAGPFGMIRAHDMRDWHQRQDICPPHPSHGAGFIKDAWWQLHCEYRLKNPPRFKIESDTANDPFYRLIEATWMFQQLPLAIVLYFLGGWAFVLWGISFRIFVSLTGHWMVGHFAHRAGHQGWYVRGLPVQGFNLPGLALPTFGENWHGNHHAFPHSAKLGVEVGQSDPGFGFIKTLEFFGFAWNIQLPHSQPAREGLARSSGTEVKVRTA